MLCVSSNEELDTQSDERTARLAALREALVGQRFNADLIGDYHLKVSSQKTPDIELSVSCRPRASDGGRLWFTDSEGRPIAEAADEHLMNAVVGIKDLTAARL